MAWQAAMRCRQPPCFGSFRRHRLVTEIAPFAPLAMIGFAIAGAALAWLAWLGWVEADAVRRFEMGQIRLWRIYGLPVLLALFLFAAQRRRLERLLSYDRHELYQHRWPRPPFRQRCLLCGNVPPCLFRYLGIGGNAKADGRGFSPIDHRCRRLFVYRYSAHSARAHGVSTLSGVELARSVVWHLGGHRLCWFGVQYRAALSFDDDDRASRLYLGSIFASIFHPVGPTAFAPSCPGWTCGIDGRAFDADGRTFSPFHSWYFGLALHLQNELPHGYGSWGWPPRSSLP